MAKLSEPVKEPEEKEKKGENLERSDYEREDLITRFDKVVRGELNDDLQVWINSNVREENICKSSNSSEIRVASCIRHQKQL